MMWTDRSVIRGEYGVIYPVAPCPAPRQVRSDTWKPRPMVQRYRAFRDHIRLLKPRLEDGAHVIFHIEMPKSWSEKKRAEMDGQPHRQRPDADNLGKALMDSIHSEDAHISDIRLTKRWAKTPAIEIANPGGPNEKL